MSAGFARRALATVKRHVATERQCRLRKRWFRALQLRFLRTSYTSHYNGLFEPSVSVSALATEFA